jgi:hypothetical protein
VTDVDQIDVLWLVTQREGEIGLTWDVTCET